MPAKGYQKVASGTQRGARGSTIPTNEDIGPATMVTRSARNKQNNRDAWREAWRRILEEHSEEKFTQQQLGDLPILHQPRLETQKHSHKNKRKTQNMANTQLGYSRDATPGLGCQLRTDKK